jgi:hypothetical protein
MFRQFVLATALLTTTLWQGVVAVDKTRYPEKIAALDTAATQLDRLALLPNDEDWVFDFTKQDPWYNFSPGGVTNMNAATFPAARKNGLTSKPTLSLPPTNLSSDALSHSGHGQPRAL